MRGCPASRLTTYPGRTLTAELCLPTAGSTAVKSSRTRERGPLVPVASATSAMLSQRLSGSAGRGALRVEPAAKLKRFGEGGEQPADMAGRVGLVEEPGRAVEVVHAEC